MTGKEFAKWMDDSGVDLATAAELFGTKEQTIYNWRSTRGVPPGREEWIRARMREYSGARPLSELPDRITLEVSPDQFDEWNRAALAEGKLLRTWAIDALDQAAAEDEAAATDPTGSTLPPDPLRSVPLTGREMAEAFQRGSAGLNATRLKQLSETPPPAQRVAEEPQPEGYPKTNPES